MKNTPEKTHDQYAVEFGVSRRTIIRWEKKGYPLDNPEEVRRLEASQKSSARLRAEVAAVQVDAATLTDEQMRNPPDLAHAMVYERILRCRLAAREVREMEARSISRDEVVAGMHRVDNAVKTVLLGLPGRAGELVGLAPAEIQRWAAVWVHETLTKLSDARAPVYST